MVENGTVVALLLVETVLVPGQKADDDRRSNTTSSSPMSSSTILWPMKMCRGRDNEKYQSLDQDRKELQSLFTFFQTGPPFISRIESRTILESYHSHSFLVAHDYHDRRCRTDTRC